MMLRNQCASRRPASARDQQHRPASNREAAPMQSARRSGHHARSPRNLVRETSGHRPPIDRAAAREAARMSRPPWAASMHGIFPCGNHKSDTCVTLNGSGIQLAVGPQPLWLRNYNSGLAQRIMVKRLVTSPHDPLGITDSACKNQLVVVSVHYGPFNTYITIRSTTIGKSRVARDPIAMHTSWRSNSDIASVTRTNQYNQDLGHIHSTNGNHLESPNEGSSIDHQVTIHLLAQNITMFPTNETWYFASQDERASGNTRDLLAAMHRVVNYHSSWARQRQVELFDASVDWAVKIRIRSPELETSICDVKYHVSLSTRCVLGKWVYLITHTMSIFDLRYVCIVIRSLATLDVPMIVDLIGIYVLKGPYCTLTTTNWFLQTLSVIPRDHEAMLLGALP
ncbi:hypothetical protein F511_32508 [Dorcoceras hygrometricum]|uniref:Uncharacterized protein n=1 Tax=Dorcoceras hygrometricum TaxID=472368 RepID=A0A2Z7C478_9LAMI|nr:hypothetical protein F511_32508 [Dorcoceras hygrometricum]